MMGVESWAIALACLLDDPALHLQIPILVGQGLRL